MRVRTRALPVSEFASTVLRIDVALGSKAKTTVIERKGRRSGHQVKFELDSVDLMATADVIARLLRDEDLRAESWRPSDLVGERVLAGATGGNVSP